MLFYIFRAKDIVKISLIPSHNAANVNNGTQNNATQIDEQFFNKINIVSKDTKSTNKYVIHREMFNCRGIDELAPNLFSLLFPTDHHRPIKSLMLNRNHRSASKIHLEILFQPKLK